MLEGEPDHRDYYLDTEKASGKIIQICISRAKSQRLVLDSARPPGPTTRKRPWPNTATTPFFIRAQGCATRKRTRICSSPGTVRPGNGTPVRQHLGFTPATMFLSAEHDYITTTVGNQPVVMVRHSDKRACACCTTAAPYAGHDGGGRCLRQHWQVLPLLTPGPSRPTAAVDTVEATRTPA